MAGFLFALVVLVARISAAQSGTALPAFRWRSRAQKRAWADEADALEVVRIFNTRLDQGRAIWA